jgi:uncharacterized protein YeeX (DUF496 family)
MRIETADDVQLLVEDFGWLKQGMSIIEVRNLLKEMNGQEHKRVSHLINQRVWDETFDDEMAVTARFDAAQRFTNEDKAIDLWFERENK